MITIDIRLAFALAFLFGVALGIFIGRPTKAQAYRALGQRPKLRAVK